MTDSTRLRRLFLALVAVVALVAAACGSSDGDDTAAVAGDTTIASVAPDDESEPEEEATPEGPGVNDDNVLIGPSGFTIDLNECPSDWSDTEGLTDTEITLGQSIAQSGALAAFGLITDGMTFYYDWVNSEAGGGGIGGRAINLVSKDDAYEPARTVTNVQELMQQDKVFAFSSILGTPPNLAVYDEIGEACVPQLFNATGHPAWGDPEFHPWTTGVGLPYNSEALLWGQYLADTYDEPVSVAALVMNNDFGISYKDAFESFAEENPDVVSEVSFELHDPAAPNVVNELTSMAGTNADIVILMTTSVYCTQSFTDIAGRAWEPIERIVSSTCAGIDSFFKPAGDTGDGWILIQSLKDLVDPKHDGEEFVELAKQIITDAGEDPGNAQYGNGFNFAWPMVESLRAADEMPGGLSRTNLMLAVRSLDTVNPMILDGVRYHLDGVADGHVVEGGQFVRYTIPEGEETGSHVPFGDVFDVDGTTPNCTFGEPPESQC